MEIRPVPTTSVPSGTEKSSSAPDLGAIAKAAVAPVKKDALVQQPDAAIGHEEIKQALDDLNKAMRNQNANLEFSFEEGSDRAIVKVVDQDTKEVIRQMPTKEALEISRAIDRMQSLLLNQKA